MPAVPNRRRASVLAAVFLSLVVLAGCTGQRDPDSWSDGIKTEFVETCDGTAAATEKNQAVKAELLKNKQPTERCQCVIDHLEKNMDFSDFKSANNDRRDAKASDQKALNEPAFKKAYDACPVGGKNSKPEKQTTTTVAKTTTTTEATTTTAG